MPNTDATRAGVKSDETLLSIVEHLRDVGEAGVTEIATHLGLAKSTVHDHLASMRAHGFVVKFDGRYALGLEFFSVGQHVRTGSDVYGAARPVVDALAEDVEEMVWLYSHENGRVMCLYGHAGETNVDASSLVGSWAYMHCNSAGKAILAQFSDAEVAAVVEAHGLQARTPDTITDPDELDAELGRIREQGYALNLGEDLKGIHAVGVPLVFEGDVKGALSVAGPAHRVDRERCETDLRDRLLAARNDVELNLAYT